MGLGTPEIIFIILIVVLLFGAKKIPELMRGLGSGIKEFKQAANVDGNDSEDSKKINEKSS